MNQNNRAKKPLRVYWDEDLDRIVQHCINPSRRDNPIKLRKKCFGVCKCSLLEKLIATNWAYYRCPKCGHEYFSSGNARVIDKTDLGSCEERKKKNLPY